MLDLSKELGACPKTIYSAFIEPVLPTLAKTCGGNLFKEQVTVLLKSSSTLNVEQLVDQMRVCWGPDESSRSFYGKGQSCDLTLSCPDGRFPVHANLVLMRGGEDLQEMALAALNKPDATLHFERVSSETLKWFVDFLYLEGEAFMRKAKRELNYEGRVALMKFTDSNHIKPLYPFNERLDHFAKVPDAEDRVFEKIDYEAINEYLRDLGKQPSSEQ